MRIVRWPLVRLKIAAKHTRLVAAARAAARPENDVRTSVDGSRDRSAYGFLSWLKERKHLTKVTVGGDQRHVEGMFCTPQS